MTKSDELKWLKGVLAEGGRLSEPSVKPIEPEIRSGGTFLFQDPFSPVEPEDKRAAVRQMRNEGGTLGTCIIEWGYDVGRINARRFRRWLQDNEPTIVAVLKDAGLADDAKYLGTYAVFSTTEKHTGNYRTIWSFNSFEGVQRFNALIENQENILAQLIEELYENFRDHSPGAGQSQQIYQPAASAHRL
jgi:hypothetical protein